VPFGELKSFRRLTIPGAFTQTYPHQIKKKAMSAPALHLGAHLFISSWSAVLNQAAYSSRSGISIGRGRGPRGASLTKRSI
jgi:hypothetical protein